LQPLVYMRMWWPAVVKSERELRLDYGRSPHAYVNQRLQIQLELLMMSGMPLETCWAFNEQWNNKFYYKVASCWLFLQSHTTMHGSRNIKKKYIYIYIYIEFFVNKVSTGEISQSYRLRLIWMLIHWKSWYIGRWKRCYRNGLQKYVLRKIYDWA
jgi:hypothetical protein